MAMHAKVCIEFGDYSLDSQVYIVLYDKCSVPGIFHASLQRYEIQMFRLIRGETGSPDYSD
jgi:hypothetical protein